MKPEVYELAKVMLVESSTCTVARALRAKGYAFRNIDLSDLRRSLVKQGKATAMRDGGADAASFRREASEGSEALLRRMLIAKQHGITCPVQFRAACESVGLAG